jgi:hypothetical protein
MAEMSDQKFANAALDAGLVTPDMIKECVLIQKRQKEMGYLPRGLQDLLVEKGYIADDVARKISRGEEATEAKKKEKVVRIGGYEVISRLGKGQMGSVYKARQISLDRILALKVLPTRLAGDKRYLQRFLREAKAAGRLNHPNIVTAVDFGESNGLYYYAMDFVDGVNVRDILEEEGKLGEDEALAIALQIGRALEHAHENNIVHRDIKPENIMLDSEGRARLCDLGLAREANEDGALTQAGIVLGTPYYVSPEQAEGRRDLDTRSDMYSLGVTLFHMVTGRVPFQGNTGPAIMVKHISDKMPDPREFNPALSNGTVQLIKKMTAKKREQRYQTPAEMVKDIERVIAGERPAAAGPIIKARKRRAPGQMREEIVVGAGGGKKFIPLVVVAVVILVVIVAVASMSDRGTPTVTPTGGDTRPTGSSGTGGAATGNTGTDTGGASGAGTPVISERPQRPTGSISDDQREIMQIKEWARTNQDKPAEVARQLTDFIETASDPKAIAEAKQTLEGVAAREFISLQRKFDSLKATGNTAEALKEAQTYLEIFGKTGSASKVAALVKTAREELEKAADEAVAQALELSGEGKFAEALDLLSGRAASMPQEFAEKFSTAKAGVEKARKDFIAERAARADSTRDAFEENVAKQVAAVNLDEAIRLINERLKLESEPSVIKLLKTRAADLAEARECVRLIMANLKNIEGLKQTFNVNKKGDSTGIIEKVGENSFFFAADGVARDVRLNEISSDDVIRLVELGVGPDEAKTRYRLGMLFLVVLDDPEEARRQLARAGQLGMDTSRFDQKLAASRVEEIIARAEDEERRRRYIEAATAYSEALDAMSSLDAYAQKKDEVKQKIESCLQESGAQNAFAGKVSIENGRLVVTYDFSSPEQWQDFEGYIWSEDLKRPIEWIVENGVLVGKGSEAILWKGQFSGNVFVEVDVSPKDADPAFFLRLCDDGKGFKGKNYSFGFGYREKKQVPVGRRGNQVIYRDIIGAPEILIAKWRGSSKTYTYLKRGISFPQIVAGSTYKVRIEREDKMLRTIVNGSTVAEVEDDDYKKGGISLKVFETIVHFDNLRISGDFDQTWLGREMRKSK